MSLFVVNLRNTLFKMTNIMLIVGSIGVVGGGARVVVSIAAFHARVRDSVPGLCGLKKQKCFFPIHV